jgi:hypothetical protein
VGLRAALCGSAVTGVSGCGCGAGRGEVGAGLSAGVCYAVASGCVWVGRRWLRKRGPQSYVFSRGFSNEVNSGQAEYVEVRSR